MPEGPMALPDGRLEELVALANRVFRSGGGDMGSEYPLVFDPSAPEGMRVMVEDGKVVSHVGVCVRDAALLGVPFRVASIGAVATDREYRGRNFASLLMEDAIAHARERGAQVMLISGDRGLYRRLGVCRPGRFVHLELAESPLPAGLTLEKIETDNASIPASLYQREPVRFVRPLNDWRRLLHAGMLMNRAAECWLVSDADRALAYVAVQKPGGDNLPETREYAGSREAVWAALGALAAEYGSSSIRVSLMPDDGDMEMRARRAGALMREGGFGGTVRLLNVADLIERIKPLWIERAGQEAVEILELEADEDGLSYRADGERVRLEGVAATTAIFGSDSGLGDQCARLPGLEPLPLFWYGYNYV